jgi:dTDP-L-rhamnose 4-epimerase
VTVLVTGGAGLIGSHLVDQLLEDGRRVRVLDNLDPQTHLEGRPEWISTDAEFIEGDVRDTDCLVHCLDGVDEIYHQAAFGGFTTEMSVYYDVNATGTARIFEVIEQEKLDVRKLVAASSQAVYGEGLYHCADDGTVQPAPRTLEQFSQGAWEPECPRCGRALQPALTSEEALWNGETPYAVSKLAEERTVIGSGRRLGIPTVALRYAVTFGPRQSVYNPYTGVVSIFSTLLLNGLRPMVYEDGRQTRDYIFVRDIASANRLVMDDERANWQVYNVGTERPVTVIELIEKLASEYELQADYDLRGEFRPGDVRHLVHDSRKLRRLGWGPETSLEQGLREFVNWIRDLGELKEYFRQALVRLREHGVVMKSGAG